jgi:predicted N-acetyltransferase YhbS
MIRAAEPHELAALSELALRSKASWGYAAEFMRAVREELTVRADDLALTFVMERDGAIAGFYALSDVAPPRVELELLFVEPRAQRGGIGRALVAHACERARLLGCETITIQGDPHAAAFYERVGARQIGWRESASLPNRLLPLYELALT